MNIQRNERVAIELSADDFEQLFYYGEAYNDNYKLYIRPSERNIALDALTRHGRPQKDDGERFTEMQHSTIRGGFDTEDHDEDDSVNVHFDDSIEIGENGEIVFDEEEDTIIGE